MLCQAIDIDEKKNLITELNSFYSRIEKKHCNKR